MTVAGPLVSDWPIETIDSSESSRDRAVIATTTRRATKRTATRARLLEAARALIGEGGFDAVTIAEVTERADVGFGTFYGYFESKDAVVRAVILEAMATLAQANDAVTEALDDPAVAGHMIGGAVLGVLRAKLAGELDATADPHVAASALVLLGVPETEARTIATRRLP